MYRTIFCCTLMKIHLLILLLQQTFAAFYEQSPVKDHLYKEVLYEEKAVPSPLACMQLCKFRDAQALMAYNEGVCRCLKESKKHEENKLTLATAVGTSVMKLKVKVEIKKVEIKKVEIKKVEIKRVDGEEGEINVALGKPVKQSGPYQSKMDMFDGKPKPTRPPHELFDAKYGNDGDLNTKISIPEPRDRIEKWLRIDLGKPVRIQRMVFRGDEEAFKAGKYENIYFTTAKSLGHLQYICKDVGLLPTVTYEVKCDNLRDAGVVYVISRSATAPLYVRELEVYVECIYKDSKCIF